VSQDVTTVLRDCDSEHEGESWDGENTPGWLVAGVLRKLVKAARRECFGKGCGQSLVLCSDSKYQVEEAFITGGKADMVPTT
jgi:hypothetical protein